MRKERKRQMYRKGVWRETMRKERKRQMYRKGVWRERQ